jgi:tetratricopeptide (TPR) repeat protein
VAEEPETSGKKSPAERMDLPRWDRARKKRASPKGQEQDTFQGTVRRAGRTARMRAPLVLGAVALVAGTVGGTVWYQGRQTEGVARATRLLATAAGYEARAQIGDVEAMVGDRKRPPPVPIVPDEATLDEKVSGALSDLDALAPESDAALVAVLMRAAKAMHEGDHASARDQYGAFIERAPAGHGLLFVAREGQALALEALGDVDGALAALEPLVGSPGTFYRDQALWQRGRILEAAGRSEEALATYREYVDQYPLSATSIAREEVRRRLVELDPASLGVPPETPSAAEDAAAVQGSTGS